jgi:hypothetical protein
MRRALLFCALASVLAATAHADVRHDPVKVRLTGTPQALAPGQTTTLSFEILVAEPVQVTNLRVEGRGWQARQVKGTASARLARGAPDTARFEVSSSDPAEPLLVRFEVDGQPYERRFDLSVAGRSRELRPVPEDGTAPFRDPDAARVVPGPRSEEPPTLRGKPDREMNDAGTLPGTAARNIRVYGRFVYERSDGVTIGADGALVRVYDEDTGFDELLAEGVTDAYGYYDFTFNWDPCWLCDGQPDIYVYFESANGVVEVEDATWESNYSWESGTTNDYTGTSLNKGTLEPSDEGQHPALHILTDISRDWRWYINREGYDTPSVDVQWPDGSTGAWYNDFWEEIHISSGRQWREDTHAHEYGHHWIYNYAVGQAPDYCNGICDDSPSDCGHCIWCRETNHDAWNEGWPNWIAHVQTSGYASTYGIASMNTRDQELVATCGEDGLSHDPLRTEGFLGALLQDIWDSANEDDGGVAGTWRDRLALGTDEIFDVTDFDHPLNPSDFLTKFRDRYPGWTEQVWETGKNVGYDLDAANPAVVTNLNSTSHTLSVSSPDPTIDFTWTRATDDWSGVSGYSVVVAGSAQLPDQTQDIGDVTAYTTGSLAPGTYYLSIRTRDRAGRWSASYASRGPYIVRAAEPANLVPQLAAGWARPVVPRGAADATSGNVPFPASLPGNSNSTYWNIRGANTGESTTSTGFQSRLYIDGVYSYWASWGAVGAGGGFYGNNLGPLTVRGGRHVYSSRVDALDAIAETSETDNVFGRQWVWTPLELSINSPVTRSAPPAREGGWDDMTEGSLWFNCDGLRFTGSGWWNAVEVHASNNAYDYDCRLHFPTANADTGFTSNRGYSTRTEGLLDAVLVNRNVVGTMDWDVGVINASGSSGSYVARHVISSGIAFGDSGNVTLGSGEYIVLREVYVPASATGPVSFTARIVSGTGPVHLLWLDRTFTTGDLMDYDGYAVTPDTATKARIDVNIPTAGYNGIVLYRDPQDGSAPVTVVLEVETTPPDYTPHLAAAGWHSPIVPRPAFDGTAASVPLPDTLHGNVASTYLNFAIRNAGPTGVPGLFVHTYLDGVYSWWLSYGDFPGGAVSLFNWNAAWTVRGGRHTLSMVLDKDDAIEEMYEDNNIYGEQYVWSPLPLVLDAPVTRSIPPDRTGGWDQVRSGEGLWYNVDGVRLPKLSGATGWWGAVAAVPGTTSDVDLRMHELQPKTKDGFRSSLAYSGWGTAQTDYVLANFNLTPFRAMDVGLLNWGGTQTSSVEAVGSITHGTASGILGPFDLAAGRALRLHEFYLQAGRYSVHLENVSGAVDWGLTLHPSDVTFQSKSTALPGGSEWFEPGGVDEHFVVEVPAAGWYCVAVWKSGRSSLALAGTYRLRLFHLTVDVAHSTIPARTALGHAHPNPFSPEALVSFDLAQEGEVRLEVFDLRGGVVRDLANGRWPPGRHEVRWDGRDGHGRPVAAGVYLLRFAAGGTEASRKVIKLR